MTYLLEYNRSTHQFHYNHLNKDERTFHSALFSYGWSPICILPEELSLDQDFIDFTNYLAKKKMGYKDPNIFFRKVVEDQLDINDIIEQYQLVVKRDLGELENTAPLHKADEFVLDAGAREEGVSGDELVIDRNIKGLDYTLAKCCSPVYGDSIFGFVTINNGIRIHRTNCPNAAAL